jgi:hypothetical protein
MMAAVDSQTPVQTGPTTGGPGIGPEGLGLGLGGQMNHMVQPVPMPQQSPQQPTAELKPNAGPSSFTPMGIMANDPVSQFGDKPPIPAAPQQMQQRPMSPLVQQQMMSRQMGPQNFQGLQGLMSQIMARYRNPYQMMQRAPMPQYRSSALNYRPNMTNAQQSLSRVAPSVAEQQRRQAIEDARIAAEQPPQDATPWWYNSGG